MMKRKYLAVLCLIGGSGLLLSCATVNQAKKPDTSGTAEVQRTHQQESPAEKSGSKEDIQNDPTYCLGVDDELQIDLLEPEKISSIVTVAPDGTIAFPYIGSVHAKNKSIARLKGEIKRRLADGYMRYPVVAVTLRASRSKKYFVYGEVLKPGPYPLEENTTVLRAISIAGGFSKFGSSSRVKVLRPRKAGPGYETVKVNIAAVMNGSAEADEVLNQGDIVVVSEGVF